jgi:hypothetical protein
VKAVLDDLNNQRSTWRSESQYSSRMPGWLLQSRVYGCNGVLEHQTKWIWVNKLQNIPGRSPYGEISILAGFCTRSHTVILGFKIDSILGSGGTLLFRRVVYV